VIGNPGKGNSGYSRISRGSISTVSICTKYSDSSSFESSESGRDSFAKIISEPGQELSYADDASQTVDCDADIESDDGNGPNSNESGNNWSESVESVRHSFDKLVAEPRQTPHFTYVEPQKVHYAAGIESFSSSSSTTLRASREDTSFSGVVKEDLDSDDKQDAQSIDKDDADEDDKSDDGNESDDNTPTAEDDEGPDKDEDGDEDGDEDDDEGSGYESAGNATRAKKA
jgi:hypothetical protein